MKTIHKSVLIWFSAQEMFERFGLENAPDASRYDYEEGDSTNPYVLNISPLEKRSIQKVYPNAKFSVHIDRPSYTVEKRKPRPEELIENLECFPKDFYVNNTMTDFQEFSVPKKGATVNISAKNIAWYRRIITAYEGHTLVEKKDGTILIDDKKASIVYNPSKTNTDDLVKSIEDLHSGMYKVTDVKELSAETVNQKSNSVKENRSNSEKAIQQDIKDFHFKIPNIFSILYNLINKI